MAANYPQLKGMIRFSLIQMLVGKEKAANLARACALIQKCVSDCSPRLVCLPECFNSPYGTNYFESYAESVPAGETCKAMSDAARQNSVWLVAGSIPERGQDGKLYNCSVTFDPLGRLVGVFRKLHLFDIDMPGQFSFKESNSLSAGKDLFSFELPIDDRPGSKVIRVGIGICYDVRFPELSLVYANRLGCQLLLFPGAFNIKTGPMHWELLARARALDSQCYVGMCSPACDPEADYVSHAESLVTSPWGMVVAKAGKEEEIIYADVDLSELGRVRDSIPIGRQRRTDVYSLPRPVSAVQPDT